MDFKGISNHLWIFYAKKLANKVILYIYNYSFVVKDFDDVFASSGIVL